MTHIFIIGSKGIPASYGGFETFVEKLTEYRKEANIQYHVACMGECYDEFYYNNARCFKIKVPQIGSAKAVYYDIKAFSECLKFIDEHHIEKPIIYVLACRIGPFLKRLKKGLLKSNGKLYVNPDGQEWKRDKWNYFIKKYWKISECLMVKFADLLICDSKQIQEYIKRDYSRFHPKTIFIAYGADTERSLLKDDEEKIKIWYEKWNLQKNFYYLVVGRFVPENNFECIIREFMQSTSNKDLVLITNVEGNKYYKTLMNQTGFDRDKRIKFVGTVYDQELLKKIREGAFAYIHGHEVGGTNPSLLEALASTKLNLLFNVEFNQEVAGDGALYWTKKQGDLSKLVEKMDILSTSDILNFELKAHERIEENYTWEHINSEYEAVFCGDK